MKNLILLGYMASGKSFIGKKLAKRISYNFIDLDAYVEKKEQKTVKQLFDEKGELYFRKAEKKYLATLLSRDEKVVIALGGGTPCYYDTMDELVNNRAVETLYLKVSIKEIIKRVTKETAKRPLIAHLVTEEALVEFVSKHLFERSYFYNKAHYVIDANQPADIILEDIVAKLF
ncbi:shikimate kinase [Lacinutrix neustonica]|uniref:Shikimate kinase n=1 Tax=Lacinutrix neustonica TaxID=2980107 RepID=A0A9E8MXC3_9FLAO|nr:shikimate kinase [Lacinutrix neustonica]WAC02009.1 shikimate kinase [Lacinutrix neustonica]